MKKRIISFLLVSCMLFGTLVGCGNTKEEQPVGSGKLTIGIPQSANVTSYDDNAFTSYVEESLGIKIEFIYFASAAADYGKQITLMCTSGEKLPDVLWGFTGIDRYTVAAYGEDGYFKDLTELIDKYGDNYKAALGKLPKDEQKMITSRGTSVTDGGFYGMPAYSASQGVDDIQTPVYINQTWLDKVGMSKPTNVDELYNVLKAFREKDPNGNGEADEIPILSKGIENYIINAFVCLGDYGFNVTDGKVWNPYTTDEYRQALIYCNKLCSDKLLDKMNYTISSSSEFKTLVTPSNDIARVGVFSGHPQSVTSTTTGILDQYTALNPLADETDKGGYVVIKPKALAYSSYITKDCDDDVTAMKFLDFFYLDETVTRLRYGVKDEHWKYEEGITNAYGIPCEIKLLDATAVTMGNATWGVNGLGIRTTENYSSDPDDGKSARNQNCRRLLGEAYHCAYDWEQPKEMLANLVYTEAENEERSSVSGMYQSYVNEAKTLFITGEKDPNNDAHWNEYLNQIKNLGEEKLLKIAQDAYSRK